MGDKVQNLRISGQKEIVSSELKEIRENIDLSNEEKLSDKRSEITIKATYGEINKEVKAMKLDQESETKFNQAKQKASKYLKHYLSGKSKIDAYSLQKDNKKQRRKRRSASQYTPSPLTREEREAFYEMYKIFEELETKQKDLLPKLYAIEGNPTTTIPLKKDKPKSSSLSSKLRLIGWSTVNQVRYTTEKPGGYGKSSTPNQWVTWDKNPYKPFLTKLSDYTGLIDKVKKAEQNRDSYSSSRRWKGLFSLGVGPGAVKSTYSSKGEYDKKVKEAQEEFANKVALKFLEWMDQKSNKTIS